MVLTVPKNLSFLKMLEQSKYEKSRWAVVSVPSIGVSHLDDGLTRGGDLLAGWGSNPVPLSLSLGRGGGGRAGPAVCQADSPAAEVSFHLYINPCLKLCF